MKFSLLAMATAASLITFNAFALEDYTILEVEGEKIPFSEVQEVWDGLFPGDDPAPSIDQFGEAIKNNVIRGIVSERLMMKDAEAGKLDERRDVARRLQAARRQVLVKEHLRVRNVKIDEAEIKARYDTRVAEAEGSKQAHASHILVESEEEAKEIHKELTEGADFALTAKRRSADVGSAAAGGDLGFFSKEQMVPEFAEAAFALEAGKVSEPVKSGFGWHIIKLHELRDMPLPSFDEARLTLIEQMRQEANQEYIVNLLKNAEVKYYDKSGKSLEFPAELEGE